MSDKRKISELIPDHANANKGTERGRYALEASLRQYGAGRSILLDKNGRIIAGNKTVEVAADVGLEDVVVVQTDGKQIVAVQRTDLDIDSPEGRGLAYADNRVGELSLEWDAQQVLADLDAGMDLSGLWRQDELDELLADFQPKTTEGDTEPQIDRAEELRQKWGVESGQMWQLGEHRLICGDCTDAATVARVMGGERAVLMATDPPYGVAYTVETGVGSKFGAIANDENDGERLQKFLESAFSAAKPVLFDNAAWYLWHAQMTQGFFAAAAAAAAVIIHRQIIWVKPSLILGHGDYHWRHELCFYGWVEGHRPPWYGDRKQTTVWEVGRENDGVHPTQKPVELFERPLRFNTRLGDIAYEPFLGSGTTLIACENLGRRCRAVEISPAYVAVALERWATHTGKTPTLIPNDAT